MCPVLVTGLGGLYSSLPTTIDIATNDWYRITPDDVADIQALTLFMNSLEFCNAVVQVAHPLIKQQLLDFMYQGFLVPVLGSTLIQVRILIMGDWQGRKRKTVSRVDCGFVWCLWQFAVADPDVRLT